MVKATWSFVIAVLFSALVFATIGAQTAGAQDDDADAQDDVAAEEAPSIQPTTASISQTVPVTLTINIPGPSGPMTVEVPIMLNLDIQIGISNTITASVTATSTAATDEDATDEDAVDVEDLPVVEEATPTPTSTPTPAPPTATPVPPTATPLPDEDTDDADADADDADTDDADTDEDGEALPTATPTGEPVVQSVEPPICPDPRAAILAPGVGEVLSGEYQIVGTATHINFDYYKLEYATGAGITLDDGEFAFIAEGTEQVVEGELVVFDTTELDNGAYTLLLTVVDQTGNFPPPCSVTVTVEN